MKEDIWVSDYDIDRLMWVQFKKGFDPKPLDLDITISWRDDEGGYYYTQLEVPANWDDYEIDALLQQEVENNGLEMEWIDVENSGQVDR